MRNVTRRVVGAFLEGRDCHVGNTGTDGRGLWLFGNMIAQRDGKGTVWITTAGYNTATTRDRLRALADVSTKDYELHLNGVPWDGEFVSIPEDAAIRRFNERSRKWT